MSNDAELLALWTEWKRLLMVWGEQTDEDEAKRYFHEGEAVAKKIAAKQAEAGSGTASRPGER